MLLKSDKISLKQIWIINILHKYIKVHKNINIHDKYGLINDGIDAAVTLFLMSINESDMRGRGGPVKEGNA